MKRGKKDARRKKIWERGWVSEFELNSFDLTVDTYRHHRGQPNPRTMTLVEAQILLAGLSKHGYVSLRSVPHLQAAPEDA